MTVHDAPAAVVVMAVDSDPRAAAAVRSVLAQDVAAELVVVNSGAGSLAPLLAAEMERLTLVESAERQLPGGARNLGLAQVRAPLVAFLAADCEAPPGWLSRRLQRHGEGHKLVASALMPAPGPDGRVSAAAWASCLATHSSRLPGSAPRPESRYGLSYARTLFDRHGSFDAALGVGEDSDFNARCGGADACWDPAIVTLHHYPQRLGEAVADQYRRGRAAARYAIGRRWTIGHFFAIGRRSLRLVRLLASGDAPPQARRPAVMALLPALILAYSFGSLAALPERPGRGRAAGETAPS